MTYYYSFTPTTNIHEMAGLKGYIFLNHIKIYNYFFFC